MKQPNNPRIEALLAFPDEDRELAQKIMNVAVRWSITDMLAQDEQEILDQAVMLPGVEKSDDEEVVFHEFTVTKGALEYIRLTRSL